jgi:hypothetical protein
MTHRSLMFYMQQEDGIGNSFLDYIFEADAIEISSHDFIQQAIDNMWDQSRLMKNELMDFIILDDEVDSDNIYSIKDLVNTKPTQKYKNSNRFMFCFTSQSIFIRVINLIFWNVVMSVLEFWFTYHFAYNEQEDIDENKFTTNTYSKMYREQPAWFIIIQCFRVSYLIGLVLQWKAQLYPVKNLNFINTLIMTLYVLMLLIYPFVVTDSSSD